MPLRAAFFDVGDTLVEHWAPRDVVSDPADCDHPSELLYLRDGEVACGSCGSTAGIEVRPDAVVADLTELPDLVRRWMS